MGNMAAMPNDKVAEWLQMWLHAVIDPAIVAPAQARLAQGDFADWIEGLADAITDLATELSRLAELGPMRARIAQAPQEVAQGLFLRAMLVCAELCSAPGATLINMPPDVRQAIRMFLGRDCVSIHAADASQN